MRLTQQPSDERVSVERESFDVLLDQLTAQVQANDAAKLEAFLRAHPAEEVQLRQLLPTVRAMAAIGSAPSATPVFGGPAESEKLLGDEPLGDFRLVRELGRGGMGIVYEAEQLSLRRRVALKVLPFAAILDRRHLQRFHNEARAAAALDHPGIVSIYSVGCDRGVHYYAMQLVEGRSLAQVVAARRQQASALSPAIQGDQDVRVREGAIRQPGSQSEAARATGQHPPAAPETPPLAKAGLALDTALDRRMVYRAIVEIGIQAAEALQYAHAHGVLHRDVKPSNLMLDEAGKVIITDFGLARIQADPGMTATGDLLGTLRYMSPEQADGQFVDERADVYSLGITLYELLSLRPPFLAEQRQELLRQIAGETPPPLRRVDPSIPRELDTIVAKAVSKEPSERYAAAGDLADDLRRFLEGRPIQARPPTLADRAGKWVRRHPRTTLGMLAFSLFVVLTLGVSSAYVWQANKVAEDARLQAEKDRAAVVVKIEELNAMLSFLVDDVLEQAMYKVDLTVRDALSSAEPALDKTFADHPLTGARVRSRLAELYGKLSLDGARDRQFTRAYGLLREHLGLESVQTQYAAIRLGQVLKRSGAKEEAIALYETILPYQRNVRTQDDVQTVWTTIALGELHYETGNHEASKGYLSEALKWRQTHLRPKFGGNVLWTHQNIAAALRTAGETQLALEILQDSLETAKEVCADREADRQTLSIQEDLASLLSERGELTQALALYVQTIDHSERALGAGHPLTLRAVSNLASTKTRMGQLSAGKELQERAVAGYLTLVGPDHEDTLRVRMNLSGTQFALGETEAACRQLEDVIARSRRSYGAEHPLTRQALRKLAHLLCVLGARASGCGGCENLAEPTTNAYGPEHPRLLAEMQDFALLVEDQRGPCKIW